MTWVHVNDTMQSQYSYELVAPMGEEFADNFAPQLTPAESQPLNQWRTKGWLYKDDPRGWFQWYCRYYMGRRLAIEDERQIKRWRAFSRHWQALLKHCPIDDPQCRPKQRQALLQWAYDSRPLTPIV